MRSSLQQQGVLAKAEIPCALRSRAPLFPNLSGSGPVKVLIMHFWGRLRYLPQTREYIYSRFFYNKGMTMFRLISENHTYALQPYVLLPI